MLEGRHVRGCVRHRRMPNALVCADEILAKGTRSDRCRACDIRLGALRALPGAGGAPGAPSRSYRDRVSLQGGRRCHTPASQLTQGGGGRERAGFMRTSAHHPTTSFTSTLRAPLRCPGGHAGCQRMSETHRHFGTGLLVHWCKHAPCQSERERVLSRYAALVSGLRSTVHASRVATVL